MARSPRRRAVLACTLVAVVCSISIGLRLNAPALLLADWGYDDALFTDLAWHLVQGDWLGPYDDLTIAKGPGYPLFIAGVYQVHLPLKLVEHVVHLLAAGTMAGAATRVSRSRWLGLAVFTALALDPTYLGRWGSVVARDGIYGSLSLLLVGAVLLALTSLPDLTRRRLVWAAPAVALVGAVIGVVGAGYYLTREERIWLVPTVAASVVLAGALWWRRGHGRTRPAVILVGALVAGAAVTATLAVGSVAAENEDRYGTSLTSDLAGGEIVRAYAEWQRIDVGEPMLLIPVTSLQREAAYRVSPAAAELEDYLDEADSRFMGPQWCPPERARCEYTGSYFVWAMREGAQVTGHGADGAEAQQFFGRMADEIAAACDAGDVPCVARGPASMPPLARVDRSRFLPSLAQGTTYLFSFDMAEPAGATRSAGSRENWQAMLRPLRGIDGSLADHNAAERRAAGRQQVVYGLADGYRWAARLGVVPAVLGLGAALITRAGRRHWPVVGLALVMLVAVLSRLALLAVVDATAFRAATYGAYPLPAVGFLVVFLVTGWWLLGACVADRWPGRGSSVDEAGGAEEVEPERDGDDRLDAPTPGDARLVPQ